MCFGIACRVEPVPCLLGGGTALRQSVDSRNSYEGLKVL
jgi:hypothetical protein